MEAARLREAACPPPAGGEQRTSTFSISNADGIESLDFVLRYDPQAVAIVDVASDGIGSDFTTLSHDMNGEVRIAMYGVLPLEGSGSILNVTVMALKDTTGQSPVTLVGSAPRHRDPRGAIDASLDCRKRQEARLADRHGPFTASPVAYLPSSSGG